jgi:hypothetical protein
MLNINLKNIIYLILSTIKTIRKDFLDLLNKIKQIENKIVFCCSLLIEIKSKQVKYKINFYLIG